jgi:hypothetical protein
MRDVLIHDYIGVDLDEVWNVASSRIPELREALDQYLRRKSGACGHSITSTPVTAGNKLFILRSSECVAWLIVTFSIAPSGLSRQSSSPSR